MERTERPKAASSSVVAYVTEDDRHAAVRRAAGQHALEHGCVVILFVADAASIWSEPLPNQWASQGEADRFGTRLGPEDLEFLGRAEVGRQVEDGRASGVETFAWLPKDHGPGALVDYARQERAHMLFVPDRLEGIDQISSLLSGATAGQELDVPGIDLQPVPAATAAPER